MLTSTAIRWTLPTGIKGPVLTVPTDAVECSFEATDEPVNEVAFNRHVDRIIESMAGGGEWPALYVRAKRGTAGEYIVMDGDHRLAAARRLGITSVGIVLQ